MPSNWMVSVRPENWETVTTQRVFAFAREDATKKVIQGDRLVVYVPGTYSIKAVFDVVSNWSRSPAPRYPDEIREGRMLYPFEAQIRVVVSGKADLHKIKEKLSFIRDKQNIGIYFQRNPGNHEQPISEEDFRLIFEELQRNPEPLGPISTIGSKPKSEDIGVAVPRDHFKTRDMLVELGKLKDMEETVAEYSFDHFKLDVAWKQSKLRAVPDYVFEVHVGGDLWKDLASLKHAFDRFHCHVILVGRPEDRNVVNQFLPGAFHEMSRNFRFVEIEDIIKLYDLLKKTKHLEHQIGL